jgi:hypothetical protein
MSTRKEDKLYNSLKRAAFKKQKEEQHGHGAKRRTDTHKHMKKYNRQRDKKIDLLDSDTF